MRWYRAAHMWAFNLIELDGTDMRRDPLATRKAKLADILARAAPGLRFNEHLDEEDGPLVFHHACKPGLEGIVSKRRDSPYSSGRSRHWVKSKNPNAPAVLSWKARLSAMSQACHSRPSRASWFTSRRIQSIPPKQRALPT